MLIGIMKIATHRVPIANVRDQLMRDPEMMFLKYFDQIPRERFSEAFV